jgi:hypothetical protein
VGCYWRKGTEGTVHVLVVGGLEVQRLPVRLFTST